jgi:hypothetical protein
MNLTLRANAGAAVSRFQTVHYELLVISNLAAEVRVL